MIALIAFIVVMIFVAYCVLEGIVKPLYHSFKDRNKQEPPDGSNSNPNDCSVDDDNDHID